MHDDERQAEDSQGPSPSADAPDAHAAPLPAATDTVPQTPDSPVSPAPATAVGGPRRVFGGATAVVLAIILGAVAGFAGGIAGSRLFPQSSQPTVRVKIPDQSVLASEPVVAAAAAALPSVVYIDVAEKSSASNSHVATLPFGHPDIPARGQASGVAYKEAPQGGTYLITNDHVVADASSISVKPPGSEAVSATLVGTDPETDIAVIKVPIRVPLIQVGQSEKVAVGQLVVAIGSPFGLEHSVSAGVVSGTHRSVAESYSEGDDGVYPLVDVIQCDAAINPGNSGGALVDRQGRLIGINSAIASDSGSSAGIGFAVPSKTAIRVADELIATGNVRHPFLGVLGQTIDADLAAEKDLPVKTGALIVEVYPDTMAEQAGIRKDDIIVALDNTPISSMEDLILAVRRTDVGQKVTLRVYRKGKAIKVTMEIGDKPPPES